MLRIDIKLNFLLHLKNQLHLVHKVILFQTLELTKIFLTLKDTWKKLLNFLERNHGMDMDGILFMYSLIKILKENHLLLEDLFKLPH